MNFRQRRVLLYCNLFLTLYPILGNKLLAKSVFGQGIFSHKKRIPKSDDLGIVVSTKLLVFNENLDNAYNASIIECDSGYLLIFRHDSSIKFCDKHSYMVPEIKLTYLNHKFEQTAPIKTLTLSTNCPSSGYCPEDARLHVLNKQLFLTYNDLLKTRIYKGVQQNPFTMRKLFLGKLDREVSFVSNIINLTSQDICLASVEKNWVPFEYPEHSGSLYYIYAIKPYTVMKVDNDKGLASKIATMASSKIDRVWQKNRFGDIRGGTPARLVDGVYLTFFHSQARVAKEKTLYYLMGAYIFQAEPPFKILAMTPTPILFENIYSAPFRQGKKACIAYPAGFAIEQKGDNALIHVSCGENDTAIRIVSIDKNALFKSMVAVK